MSSPANGPYKSRLFNFLNRQARRLKEQYSQAVRHTQVAVVWGVQVALYPVYVLVQAVRLAGHKLQQATLETRLPKQDKKPSPPPDTPPPADMPIQRVLSMVVENAPLGARGKRGGGGVGGRQGRIPNSPFPISSSQFPIHTGVVAKSQPHLTEESEKLSSTSLAINGVACLLESRRLVLVTVDNQILDILTIEQRQKLDQRIICEIAYYWRLLRRAQASRRQFSTRVQMLPQKQSSLLPPVRFFWQVMAWVQLSPVACTVNLFGESTLVKSQESRKKRRVKKTKSRAKRQNFALPFVPSLAVIDRQVAEIEVRPLQQASQLRTTIGSRTQVMLQRLQTKIRQPLAKTRFLQSPISGDSEENKWLRIQTLMRAAIDYFFGERGLKLPWRSRRNQVSPGNRVSKLPPDMANNPQLAAAEEEDGWLTWKNLFDELAAPIKGKRRETPSLRDSIADGDNVVSQAPALLPGKTRVKHSLPAQREVPSPRSIFRIIRRNLTPRQTRQTNLARRTAVESSELAETQQNSNSVTESQTISAINVNITVSTKRSRIERVAQDSAQPVATSSQDKDLPDYKPDWIETEATSTGYVKTPLKRLMELLDRGILWVEELLAKIWRWVKGG